MSEENFENNDSVEENILMDVETEIETPEIESSQKEQKVEEEKPELPWKKKKSPPETVPYNRFSEVISDKNQLKSEVESYKQKYEELERKYQEVSTKSSAPQESEVKEPNIADYSGKYDTPEEALAKFLSDRDRYIEAKTRETFKDSYKKIQEEQSQEAAVRDEYQRTVETFSNKIAEAVKVNPEVENALVYINENYAKYIPHEVQFEMAKCDNVADIIFELASNEKAMADFLKYTPMEAIKKLARMDAKYEYSKAKAPEPVEKPKSGKIIETVSTTKGGKRIADMDGHELLEYINKNKR